ncbi:L,D-transpeptidase [Rhodomicrobium sp. R_RK_3]
MSMVFQRLRRKCVESATFSAQFGTGNRLQLLISPATSWTNLNRIGHNPGEHAYIAQGFRTRPSLPGSDREEMGMTEIRSGKYTICLRHLVACVALLVALAPVSGGAAARELVSWDGPQELGTVVIKTSERRLYYVLGHGMALRYDVAVGKAGMQWAGQTFVQAKREHPTWTPTPRMRRENPYLPQSIGPGASNPLGARAIYLGWTEYRIHGTNAPWSIGSAASSGCIRMRNGDVVDLFQRVHIGAPVHVIR